MLSLKLFRSLVLGEPINTINNIDSSSSSNNKSKTPVLIFTPTKEIIKDTTRLATIAREIGMDLYPNPSLSHIIFSWPTSSSSSSSPSLSSSSSSSSSSPSLPPPSFFSSSSTTWPSSSSSSSLSEDFVPLPFPSLITSSISQLRCFVNLSKGLFKLAFYKSNNNPLTEDTKITTSNWDCSSLSLFSRVTGDRIDSMDKFSRVLAGMGWTLFKTKNNPSLVSSNFGFFGSNSVYLFKKVDFNRVQTPGEFRVRELRLPHLDFKNAPFRILQYIILMADDVFYLA